MSRRHSVYAVLLGLGALILLARTIIMLSGGALSILTAWAGVLLAVEFTLDAVTLLGAVRWWSTGTEPAMQLALRVAAGAALLHAVRVLVFALGRTGPWIDFDVRPEERAAHVTRWTWNEVYFASVLAALGVVGVIVIWQYRRRARPSAG
jgi:hypothetical protein